MRGIPFKEQTTDFLDFFVTSEKPSRFYKILFLAFRFFFPFFLFYFSPFLSFSLSFKFYLPFVEEHDLRNLSRSGKQMKVDFNSFPREVLEKKQIFTDISYLFFIRPWTTIFETRKSWNFSIAIFIIKIANVYLYTYIHI